MSTRDCQIPAGQTGDTVSLIESFHSQAVSIEGSLLQPDTMLFEFRNAPPCIAMQSPCNPPVRTAPRYNVSNGVCHQIELKMLERNGKASDCPVVCPVFLYKASLPAEP